MLENFRANVLKLNRATRRGLNSETNRHTYNYFRFKFSFFIVLHYLQKKYYFNSVYRHYVNQKEKRNMSLNSQNKMCSVTKVGSHVGH